MPQSTALPAPTRRQGASVNLAEPRAARTHEALTTALFTLLREHDLTEISISELCRTAGVHRTTFYGHYADIYAFAADSFGRLLDELAPVEAEAPEFVDGTPEAVTESIVRLIRFDLDNLREHREAYRSLFRTRVDAGFRRELYERSLTRTQLVFEIWRRHNRGSGINHEVAAVWFAGGITGVLEAWALSDDDDSAARALDVVANWPSWMTTDAPAKAPTG